MALAIDASSPATATQTSGATATVTTASFTPPAGSVLLVQWSCDASALPSAPSITDNLGTPLTYTRTDWQSGNDSPGAGGQAAAWTANVATSAAMTVTVTSGSASGERVSALNIRVLTGADTTSNTSPVGAHGKSGSKSASSIAQSYTAQATNAWGFIIDCDFDQVGAQTAGTGCTLTGSANVATNITYGFARRTTADDTNGSSNTLNVTLPATSTNLNWVYVEIMPAVAASMIPPSPQRTIQGRDPGEAWWLQRDRRDANTVGSAANPLVPPLDSAWQAGGRYWHLYGDCADAAPRTWQSLQRNYTSDPSLLGPAPTDPLTLTWGVEGNYWHLYDDWRRPGPWPQQRPYISDPSFYQPYQLENELLGSVDDVRRHTIVAAYADRREVPQQRPYISDPLLLTTAQLENELLGSADDERRRYLEPAYYDRREVPQQRLYISDPNLLQPSLLENELLGGAETPKRTNVAFTHAPRWWMPQQPNRQTLYFDAGPDVPPLTLSWGADGRYSVLYNQAGWQPDRREVPQQRLYISDPSFYPTVPPLDPLTVAWGVEGVYWHLYNTAAEHVDRREVPQQRLYISDPSLLATALLENELLGSGDDLARHYRLWAIDRREVPQQRLYISDPSFFALVNADPLLVSGGVGGDIWRRYNWPDYADRREVPQQRPYVSDPRMLIPDADPLTLLADLWRRWFTPAYADRREVPQQPPRWQLYFDAGPANPPLTLSWGAGGNYWHLYNWRRPARSWWPPRLIFTPLGNPCVTLRPTPGITSNSKGDITTRPNTGITLDECHE